METKKKMTLKFYQNLGKLFYAIAASDKIVRIIEHDISYNPLLRMGR